MVQDIFSGTSSSGAHEFVLVDNTIYFTANEGTNGYELWALDPANITGLGSGSGSGSSGGMTDVTNAMSCVATPSLPTGLNIDSSTCTISGMPTVEAVNATYEINATISGVTYIGSVWLSAAPFGTITSAVEGAALNLSEAMTPITFNYSSQAQPTGGSSGSGTTTYGNGSTWNVTDLSSSPSSDPGRNIFMAVGDTIYFDADDGSHGRELMAHDTSNDSTWLVADIRPGTDSSPGPVSYTHLTLPTILLV